MGLLIKDLLLGFGSIALGKASISILKAAISSAKSLTNKDTHPEIHRLQARIDCLTSQIHLLKAIAELISALILLFVYRTS